MPFGFKEGKTNTDTDKNMPINTTTKSMNAEEKTKLLTFPLRKENVEEKNEEKEGIFEQFMNKFINFIKTKEPGWMSYHLPGEHTEKMLNIGVGMTLFGMWSAAGALVAAVAGSPIVAEGLVFTALVSTVVGVPIAAITLLKY